ncbi:MAG: TIGR00730 family Rossman fold protein [Candidatus Gastranaerophilales bacterium]|nr:TIGR00730 family Rossman fold protein [Candidatus Gastranaerophilales bacterium]
MNKNIDSICVFASASNNVDKIYFNAAYELGCEIANNNYNVVYGASNLGLMGEVTNAARINGSEIIGVMPEKLYNFGIKPGECTKFILTKGMRERKAKMDELSQAIIALAGGFGTLEELSEMIVQKQLGYNNKPIVLLNTNGFYNDLVKFFDTIIAQKFAPEISRNLYFVATNPKQALEYINNYDFKNIDFLAKKLEKISKQ